MKGGAPRLAFVLVAVLVLARPCAARRPRFCLKPNARGFPAGDFSVRDIDNVPAFPSLASRDDVNFSSCAVVGNAGTLQGTTYGEAIDGHGVVVRLNQAPTEGYERHVGSRASMRVMNKHWLVKYVGGSDAGGPWAFLPAEPGVVLMSRGDLEVKRRANGRFSNRDRKKKIQVKRDAIRWQQRTGNVVMRLSQSVGTVAWRKIDKFSRCLENPSSCNACQPTTGFIAVAMALGLCNRVTLYGIGGVRDPNATSNAVGSGAQVSERS